MLQEGSVLEEIRDSLAQTNVLLRVAFADQLRATVERVVNSAIGSKDDQVGVHIVNRLLLRPHTVEELSSLGIDQQNVSRRTIQRRLEKFVETGIIRIERRATRVEYILRLEALI